MKFCLYLVLSVVLIIQIGAPPVTEKKKSKHGSKEGERQPNEAEGGGNMEDWDLGIEYNRYLKEVVQVLESDDDFRHKLEKADPNDIKSGKIAHQLEFVNHNVRSKLDELKRQELERLRHLAIQEYEMNRGMNKKNLKIPTHVDPRNQHTFEIEDLRKLIVQTTRDLEEADRKRHEDFQKYEMEKEFGRREKLKQMDEEARKAEIEKHNMELKKHKDHPKLHHPGSRKQLEEVWEEQDHMSPEDFNPNVFFAMHDLDGNGVWDINEVKALFKKELDKMYDPNAPEDDIEERREEMERMREHVFNETDTNHDQLISFEEFLEQSRKQEFQQDEGWEGLDEQDVYSEKEYLEYERRRQEEIQRMIDAGIDPQYIHGGGVPQHGQVPVQYAHGQVPGQHGQVPVQHMPQGQVPVQHAQGQVPMQHAQGQIPVQHAQGQVPVQHVQGQVPVQHVPQGQIPVQHAQGQVPGQQAPAQIPVQHVQGQVPVQQGQAQGQQIPQGHVPGQGQVPVQPVQGQAPVPQRQRLPEGAAKPQNLDSNQIPPAVVEKKMDRPAHQNEIPNEIPRQ